MEKEEKQENLEPAQVAIPPVVAETQAQVPLKDPRGNNFERAEEKKRGSRRGGRYKRREEETTEDGAGLPGAAELIEKVIAINRVTKVTKGGKKLSFSALVVVGDMKGHVGYSLEKAKEVSIAIRKALGVAKKNMVKIPLKGTTITHEIIGACGGSRVLLKPASEGTGVIAAGAVRAVCDGAGIRDILTKCHRSSNPINVVKATMDGLMRLKSAKE